ncbi:hypothetical protein J3R82DRAFT_6154 [Butyriboletus roseoflavus]|nr:hypothetical protein J3R82DRAFT_6154 [Butyriboletus roseoflavus]
MKHPLYLTAASSSSSSPSSTTNPAPDIRATKSIDNIVLDDPRTTDRTQSILYDGICDAVVQRVLPSSCPYQKRRDTYHSHKRAMPSEVSRRFIIIFSSHLYFGSVSVVRIKRPPPTPSTVPLDFVQVLQATTASRARYASHRFGGGGDGHGAGHYDKGGG